jgi:hypothetical protein
VSPRDDLRALIPAEPAKRAEPSQKYRPVDAFFASLLGARAEDVYTAGLSKPGNVSVRFAQSKRAGQARYLVGVVEGAEIPGQFDATVEKVAPFVGPGLKAAAVLLRETTTGANDWGVGAVVERPGGPVYAQLAGSWPAVARHDPAPQIVAGPGPSLAVPLSMDEATSRMARLAVASSPAVMLVGPPGTGKNRLLNEIIAEARSDPSLYGFTKAHDVVIEPADEGWTTRDLVGGETVDAEGVLRFRPGRVLDAVAHDRWLVIDEANRADLDRIFGGLLTWLSRQQVIVGRASTRVDAPLVRLGWTAEPSSRAEGAERLSGESEDSGPIDYWAGTEFRLLGTYNALDAQRVFRFGLALGRRFAQVPVPPADVDDFATMLTATAEVIADAETRALVQAKVTGLYRAHFETPGARVGPAMLLSIPEYVAKGLALPDLAGIDPAEESDVARLVVEAYLLSVGSWLARLDENSELPALAGTLTGPAFADGGSVPAALTADQWTWVQTQLQIIGG